MSPQRGLIRTPEDVFTIHPLPDRLGLEKNKTRAHVIHRRSTTSLESVGKALKIEKRSENWCGVEGGYFNLKRSGSVFNSSPSRNLSPHQTAGNDHMYNYFIV